KPEHPPDPLEPLRLANTAAQMSLKHVVVTSVDRDDLPDKGAGHYAATIRALKHKVPQASVEVLTPDFLGYEEEALRIVLAERPEVFNHNIETVRRLHRRMRGAKVEYDRALTLLARAKEVAYYHERGPPRGAALLCPRLPVYLVLAVVHLCVVEVLLGERAPDRPGVGPDDVGVVVAVGVEPRVVAEEAGLKRVVCRRQVRHRGGRHARVVVARACTRRVRDLRGGDVVAARELAVVVVAVVIGHPEPRAVVRHFA